MNTVVKYALLASCLVFAGAITNGYWNGGNGAITGFQVFFSSGNLASGSIKVYGLN